MKNVFLLFCGLLFICSPSIARESRKGIDSRRVAEPVKCYKLVWGTKDTPGQGLTTGQAVDLCRGTTNAAQTTLCFVQAWSHPGNGGLGLTAGLAIALCKSKSSE